MLTTRKKLLLFAIISIGLGSCDPPEDRPSSSSHSQSPIPAISDRIDTASPVGTKEVSFYNPLACELCAEYPGGMDRIIGHTKEFMKGDDSCVDQYIDSLAGTFITDTSRLAMVLLDSIVQTSDGDVAEYLCDVSVRLLDSATVPYLEYLNTRGKHNALTLLLAEGLQHEVESVEDQTGKRKEIEGLLHKAAGNLRPRRRAIVPAIIKLMNAPTE